MQIARVTLSVNIQPLAKYAPTSITKLLAGGPLERLFWRMKTVARSTTEVKLRTPVGEFPIQVWDTWRLLDEIRSGGQYEIALMESISSEFTSGSVFYDIGSRWGIFSKMAIVAGIPPKNIHAFEANSDAFNILQTNLAGHDVSMSNNYVGEGKQELELDDYALGKKYPSILKIDVEGAEARVVRGADNILNTENPICYIEMHPEYLQDKGDDQYTLLERLKKYNYDLQVCLENREQSYRWRSVNEVKLPSDGDYLLMAK